MEEWLLSLSSANTDWIYISGQRWIFFRASYSCYNILQRFPPWALFEIIYFLTLCQLKRKIEVANKELLWTNWSVRSRCLRPPCSPTSPSTCCDGSAPAPPGPQSQIQGHLAPLGPTSSGCGPVSESEEPTASACQSLKLSIDKLAYLVVPAFTT